MDAKFEQFVKERRYLKNVSPKTIEWYYESFRWLQNPNPTQSDLTDLTIRMREAGLVPSSCNNRLRAVAAYLRWIASPLKVAKLKEPQRVLQTFTVEDIAKIVAWKPCTPIQSRIQVLMLMLVDTGCRISELLNLRWDEIDFDNLLVTVVGKGDKQRIIPFSFELRRILYKFKQKSKFDLVFGTRCGTVMSNRNTHRAVQSILETLKIKIPARKLHAFRHTFATNFVRLNGSVFLLQKTLGHSSLAMSRRYCHMETSDLQAIHQKISLLSKKVKG